jgi:predicted nucleic acid-binding protein
VLYFDTSFLAPLILPEATSDKIAAFLRRLPAAELTVSHWTRVEFSSLIAREVRMGGLDVQAAARADARFEVWPSGISAGSKPDYGPETLSTWPSPTIIVLQ